VAPTLLPHETIRDTKLAGYEVINIQGFENNKFVLHVYILSILFELLLEDICTYTLYVLQSITITMYMTDLKPLGLGI